MKVFAWFNSDLDGVASAILLKKVFKQLEYKSVFFGDFERQFTEWFEDNHENYAKIFIVGMAFDQQMINRLDDHKIIFVSDGPEKLNVFDSTWIQEETSSCCKLLYNKFKNKISFSLNVKKFIAYVDDYNSYNLKSEEAKYINALYRKSFHVNRFNTFVKRFSDGYDGLSDTEQNIANQFFKEIEEEAYNLDLYKGEFKGSSIISFFTTKSINEVSKIVLDNHDVDAVIAVNTDTQFVSFRAKKGKNVNVKLMAENLCKGGGTRESAGGKITPKFLEFSQNLIKI